jgi:hypothetical protein
MGRTAGKVKQEMTLIDFGDFKIRFDPKEVRINIDGDIVDVGARRKQVFPELDEEEPIRYTGWKIDEEKAKKILGQKSP